MVQFCGDSEFTVWDIHGSADFSLCFEESVLTVIPNAALILYAFLRYRYLRSRSLNEHKRWHITLNRILALAYIVTTMAAKIIVLSDSSGLERTGSLVMSSAMTLVGSVAAGLILYLEHRYMTKASTGLLLYWLTITAVWIIRMRSLSNSLGLLHPFGITLIIQSIITFASFVLENLAYVPDELDATKPAQPTPLGSNVNVFSRVTYWYIQPLLILGSKKTLTIDDLWRPDKSHSASAIHTKFERYWRLELEKAKKENRKPQLINALLRAYFPALLLGFGEYCIKTVCTFMSPILLNALLTFLGSGDTRSYIGYYIATGILLNALISVFMGVESWITAMGTGYQIRTAINSHVFRKSLRLTNASRQSTSTGQINNFLTTDSGHLMNYMQFTYLLLGIPIHIIVAIYLLWQQLGASCLAGLAVIFLAFPIQRFIGARQTKVFTTKQARGDKRIELVNETLASIKLLKLYGWDMLFHKRVTEARDLELESIKLLGVYKSLDDLVSKVTPLFVSLASFAVFTVVNSGSGLYLDANRIFVSLYLFDILSMPIAATGAVFNLGSAAWASQKRIETYFLLDEIDESNVNHNVSNDGNAIVIENGSFNWNGVDEESILKDINLVIPNGSLVAVIGRVGTGKSSLLSCLLGDMHKCSGNVSVSGTIAYVSQQAFIENATVRDNILFGSEYDAAKFNAVIDACALRRDLDLFSAGDLTEIGENGVNLSGGQKQRISLARAVYNESDIYLLDDVLSAVDAHVSKHIFDHVIGPNGILKGKTRVFVTHGIQYLQQCDQLLLLKDKSISEQGSFQQLMDMKNGTVKGLIDEFAGDDESDIENSNTTSAQEKPKEEALPQKEPNTEKSNGKLISKETTSKGLTKTSVYIKYARTAGIFWVVVSFVLLLAAQVVSVGTGVWLDHWSTQTGDQTKSTFYYLGIYATLVILASCLVLSTNLSMYIQVGQRAAKILHSTMLKSVLHSPMSFFDTTPLGRITNRFVGDIASVDESLVDVFVSFFTDVTLAISSVVVVCAITPMFIIVIIPLFALYIYIQLFYLKSSQAVQRVSRTTGSPVFSHANTTFTGAATVRAFQKTELYISKNNRLQDAQQTTFLSNLAFNKWLQFRLECIGALITFGAAIFAVIQRDSISAGSAGLSMNYAVQITGYLYMVMLQYGMLQNAGVSLERVFEYFDLPSEGPQHTPFDDDVSRDGRSWPKEGHVEFKDLALRYRDETPLALKGISVSIQKGEKVGIVGRTGAGKSSLSAALFRLTEAASGAILIDGIDISKLGLHKLRTSITVLPQDPILFAASVRDNIDPRHEHSDDAIWNVLEATHVKHKFSGHEQGLEQRLQSGGGDLSVGERQLFCLARAILRNTQVYVLDEATAGIDVETDMLIQETIRHEFKDATVLTIAHRIQTIMDYDKILVLNDGKVEEFDTPSKLLKDPNSAFSQLATAAGIKESDTF